MAKNRADFEHGAEYGFGHHVGYMEHGAPPFISFAAKDFLSVFVGVGGVWTAVRKIYAGVSGAWAEVKAGVGAGGAWKP